MPLSFNHQQQQYSIIKKSGCWPISPTTIRVREHTTTTKVNGIIPAFCQQRLSSAMMPLQMMIAIKLAKMFRRTLYTYLVVVCVPRLITLLNDCLNHLHTKIGLIVVPILHSSRRYLKVILSATAYIDQKVKWQVISKE